MVAAVVPDHLASLPARCYLLSVWAGVEAGVGSLHLVVEVAVAVVVAQLSADTVAAVLC